MSGPLLALMGETVMLQKRTGGGGLGPGYAAPTSHPALIVRDNTLVITESGETVTSPVTVHLPPTDAVNVGSRCTLPEGTVRTVIAVKQHVAPGAFARVLTTEVALQ